MRLDKYLANYSSYSRSEIKKRLKLSAVSVNQQICLDGSKKIKPEQDHIQLDGNTISLQVPRYFMLYKPKNVISANKDSTHQTVIDLINEENKQTLQIAGRLDKDTTGLVLITDDGQWNHRVTSPSNHCFKTYQVKLQEPISNTRKDELVEKFKQGLRLKNEKKLTAPAKLRLISSNEVELDISEGKYHQVKRMFAAVNNHVLELHRVSIGNIVLDPKLKAGEYRALTSEEVAYFAN